MIKCETLSAKYKGSELLHENQVTAVKFSSQLLLQQVTIDRKTAHNTGFWNDSNTQFPSIIMAWCFKNYEKTLILIVMSMTKFSVVMESNQWPIMTAMSMAKNRYHGNRWWCSHCGGNHIIFVILVSFIVDFTSQMGIVATNGGVARTTAFWE